MTNQQHPITPSPKLVEKWADASARTYGERETYVQHEFTLATKAARWGADQELEACCEWVSQWRCLVGGSRPEVGLRAARRPKPPSLKEQALEQLRRVNAVLQFQTTGGETSAIRRALEALND